MKHFLNLDAAQYAAVETNKRDFLLLKLKRDIKPGDELIIENSSDNTGKQLVISVAEVLTEPGLMKGWEIVTIKQSEGK